MTQERAEASAHGTPPTIPDGALDLGPGERPTEAREWEQRLRAAGERLLAGLHGDLLAAWRATQVTVTQTRPGEPSDQASAVPQIAELEIDATGVRATQQALRAVAQISPSAPPTGATGEPLTFKRVAVRALPVDLDGTPVEINGWVENLTVLTTPDEQGHLWMHTDPGQVLHQLQGRATVTISQENLQALARELVSEQISAMGATLVDLEVEIDTRDRRSAMVDVAAKVRKGLLSASVRMRVGARVDDQMMAHLGQIQARSGNPLVGMILATVRGRLDRYAGQEYDLNSYLPAGIRLVDLSLQADEDLIADVAFA